MKELLHGKKDSRTNVAKSFVSGAGGVKETLKRKLNLESELVHVRKVSVGNIIWVFA